MRLTLDAGQLGRLRIVADGVDMPAPGRVVERRTRARTTSSDHHDDAVA